MKSNFDIRSDFIIFEKHPDLAYFDSASTTLVPREVINATAHFLSNTVASARRGAHTLATSGSTQVEKTRFRVADFLRTEKAEISFQSSVPSSVASIVYGYNWKGKGKNKIVIGTSEEHSVMVALMRAAQVLDLNIEFLPIDSSGQLESDKFESTIDSKTGIAAICHTTIATGTINPVNEISRITHETDTILLTDMTRSLDFYCNPLSTIKSDIILVAANMGCMAPPGLIIQWTHPSIGHDYQPGILGGSSVANVSDTSFEIALQPDKFESGIINVPAIVGLEAAINYLERIGAKDIYNHIQLLTQYLIDNLCKIEHLKVHGTPTKKSPILSFSLGSEDEMSCHDIALFLDQSNIAVRSGLLCAQPLVSRLSNEGVVQISLHGYNSIEDCSRLVESLKIISSEFL